MFNMQSASMKGVANVQVRDVPEDVHRRLKSQAALAGQSLNEFLLAHLAEIARRPTLAEVTERVRRRPPYDGPRAAEAIRAGRAGR
jgi:antitoxin FitA